MVAFFTESRRRRWEVDSRWHEERRQLASALVSESIRAERSMRTYLQDLPDDDSLRVQMLALGCRSLDDLPDDASIGGPADEMRLEMITSLLGNLEMHAEKAEQILADLALLSSEPVSALAEQLGVSLEIVATGVGGLFPREQVLEKMVTFVENRRYFQRAIRDELNGARKRRLRRLWRERQREAWTTARSARSRNTTRGPASPASGVKRGPTDRTRPTPG